ncbi:MAG: hypothetical protein OEY49_05120 [Candidatus Heimdallarchaeota archaeon]|nr:hypothetical protein [Candidatus Heimdallarchaeota archaeon]
MNGTTIFSHKFDPEFLVDTQLFGGGLTAILQFFNELFKTENTVDVVKINDYSCIKIRIQNMNLFYVFIGNENQGYEQLVSLIINLNKDNIWNLITPATIKFLQLPDSLSSVLREIIEFSFI